MSKQTFQFLQTAWSTLFPSTECIYWASKVVCLVKRIRCPFNVAIDCLLDDVRERCAGLDVVYVVHAIVDVVDGSTKMPVECVRPPP
jgi:hypothetical protein